MRLVEYFVPAMALVRQFAAFPEDDAAALNAKLLPLLERARQQASAAGVAEADVLEALFAVAAWIDETLLTCGWAGAPGWQRLLLQRRLFKTSNAGVLFFERFEALAPTRHAVDEVYTLCLALGFQGRLGYEGRQAELAAIRARALDRGIARAGDAAAVQDQMFPEGYAAAAPPALQRLRWRPSRLVVVVVGVSLALLLALYTYYHVVLTQRVGALLPLIR